MADGLAAFALVYLTFFLDNVLLTVLVPILPEWVGGGEASPAALGAVLGAKAAAQLAAAPLAAAAVGGRGPAPVLRAATATLASSALVLALCGRVGGGPWLAGAARAVHGAGAAGAGVAGLALAARAVPAPARDRALAALLGAVALGVLVGYPCGGAAYALPSRAAPFLLLTAALATDLALQYIFLDREDYNRACPPTPTRAVSAVSAVSAAARRGAAGWCAGAVLLTTSVMAALEPCLPLWITGKFHPQRWQTGAVFVPDSAAYLAATAFVGGYGRRLGAERVALAGQAMVGLAALGLPHVGSLWGLAGPHIVLGWGLGAVDAALVPALVAEAGSERAAGIAALLQAAGSAAYAAGPVAGGALAALVGFETLLRLLGVLNLLYLAALYRALAREPLSEQWGASPECSEEEDTPQGGYAPLP